MIRNVEEWRQVRATDDELAEWRRRHPTRHHPPYRAECLACGRRIWYSGLAVGSHRRACPAIESEVKA